MICVFLYIYVCLYVRMHTFIHIYLSWSGIVYAVVGVFVDSSAFEFHLIRHRKGNDAPCGLAGLCSTGSDCSETPAIQ